MKAIRVIWILVGWLILTSTYGFAQQSDPRDVYLQSRAAMMSRAAQARAQDSTRYEGSRQEMFLQGDIFRKKIKGEFLRLLREPWEQSQIELPEERYSSPKPEDITSPNSQDEQPTEGEPSEPQRLFQGEESSMTDAKMSMIWLNFYGAKLRFITVSDMISLESTSEDGVADMWSSLDEPQYQAEALVKELVAYKTKLKLNDYSFFMLVEDLAAEVFRGRNERVVFQNYVLLKSGYDSLIARKGDSLVLLLSLSEKIWGRANVATNNKVYYLYCDTPLDGVGEFTIMKRPFSFSALIPASTLIESPLALPESPSSFELLSEDIQIRGSVNRNIIDLYDNYPLCENRVYRDAPLSGSLSGSLISALRSEINGRSEHDALGFLLKLVQSGFRYMRDDDQFNREKPMFPEELLFYPASDCEDRAHLFAHLVKSLLDLDVVFIQYSDHLATAVRLATQITSEFKPIKVGSQLYTICDPTSRQLVGTPMPNYTNKEYKIVL